jgi:hypothetical protein
MEWQATPISAWLRRFLACNPFYLISAALLLYGLYRVSNDPNFLKKESAQLMFNFTSLQVYEVLLVITAIFLARRRIRYDSGLLVGLENLLVLAPFILISAAALIDTRMVWQMCVLGGVIAVVRFASIKWCLPELRLRPRLLAVGLTVLVVNVVLPIVYRMLHENKVGTRPTWGAAYYTNEFIWLLLLPMLWGLINFLAPDQHGRTPPAERRWLPVGLFSLWMAGTGVHLYSLGYVYDFNLRPALLAPTVWILLWTFNWRLRRLLPELDSAWKAAALVPPLLSTFLGASQLSNQVFLTLTLLNAGIYGGIYFVHRDQRLALHLLSFSLLALTGGMPEEWGRMAVSGFSRARSLGAGTAIYLLVWAARSSNPKHGLFGALVSATVVIVLLGSEVSAFHWAFECGVAFLLLHSLRWVDAEHDGATAVRIAAGLAWVGHAFLWSHVGAPAWTGFAVAAPVLGGYLAARGFGGKWGPIVIPLAAVLTMLAAPGHFTVGKLQVAPTGLLAVASSFILFGCGTLAALTKHRWHQVEGGMKKSLLPSAVFCKHKRDNAHI